MIETTFEKLGSETIRCTVIDNGVEIRNIDFKQHYTYIIDSIENPDHRHQGKHCIIMKFINVD